MNFPEGQTIKIVTALMCTIAGYVALIRLYAIFGFFGQNIGQKHLKKGLKRLGLVWYDSVVILGQTQQVEIKKIGEKCTKK